jgi:hypothetical protein
MEQYDDTFENVETSPSIKEIEKRLRRLGCTKDQVRRHLDQVTRSRTEPIGKKPKKHRTQGFDWP